LNSRPCTLIVDPYAGFSKGGLNSGGIGNPRCRGLRKQPPDAEKDYY